MPNKCCVPKCKSNLNTGPYIPMFSFPKQDPYRSLWLRKILRTNMTISKNTRVCIKHFREDFIIRINETVTDDENGPVKQRSKTERRGTLEKLFNKHKKFKILGTASFVVSLGTGLVYYAVVLSIFHHSLDSFSTISGRGKHYIIPREGWDGKPPLNGTKPLIHPVPLVIIIHTATSKCGAYEKCKLKVAAIQAHHVAKLHEPDIGYNFLIGGDGNIYEGRGWDIENYSRNDSISITFIGNFIYDKLTSEMIEASKNLIAEGVRLKKISEDYLLVCHNQTKNTLSPGENVYREVQKWSHFKPVIIT